MMNYKLGKTLKKGGKNNLWDLNKRCGFKDSRCVTLFDTGADSANYIYQYYLNMLKEFMDLDVYQIEEYVKFGDQKQTAIYEAVALKVRFEDVANPMSGVVDEGRFHIFKVINVPTAPNVPTPPLIIGLPTICSWYLTLLVNTLNHNHKLMHTGMKSQETFEEELRRLRIRPIATRVSKRKNEDLDANNSNKLCKIASANELDTDDIQLEIECKFVLGYKLNERLAKLDCTEIIIIDTYYDNLGDYWISGSDKWLRQRGTKFELKMPSLIGHQGGISSYMEVTTNAAILEALSIYGHIQEITFDEMKMILKKHHIIPYARIETFRKSFKGLTQKVSTEYEQFIYPNCSSHKHLYQIDVDDAHLICTLTHERSNYVIAEVELAKPYIMDPMKSITDVMNQLNIDPAALQQSLNGKLVECVKRHNLKCYEILLANGVVKDSQSLVEIANLDDMAPDVVDEVSKYHYATQLQLDQRSIYPLSNNNNNALFGYKIPYTTAPANILDGHRYNSIHDLLSDWDQLDTYTLDSTDTYDLYCDVIRDTSTKLSQFQFLQSNEKLDLKEKLREIDAMIFNAFNRDEYMEATIPPWSFVYEESPEELGSYIPCDNTGLYNYLSTTYDEALEKYRQDCLKACHPAAYEYLQDILNSDLCIDQFCPKEWLGMKNVEPIDIKFSPAWEQVKVQGLGPKGTKAFVNEKMKPHYHKEFQRMLLYMYKPSNSSTASRIQVADKATPPWVRICGDYRPVNKYVLLPQVNIPNVEHQINRAKNANMFLNIDLANGFHNMPISEATSQALALSTEFGLVQPRFMPEGVRSAPQEFQRLMRHAFSTMEDCAIVIWDNVLILCDDLADLKQKFIQVLNLCKHFNIILKMAKSEIGFKQAAFFGYLVKKNTVELTQDRKDGINAMTFFKSLKGAQSFLGSCIFFQKFVPNYAELSAPLNSMTHKNFNWDESTWTIDYRKSFEDLKQAIQNSMVLHFPDYSKLWILRTDTSKDAVGVALFQVGDDGVFEPIAFYSQKLSDQARNWSAVKLEAYGVYFGVKKFAYFLLGHQFVIEVDHANLVTMETSDQYIIQRWRSFLEPFAFRIRHIKGKHNLLADYQSRMFSLISHTLDDNTFYNNHDASYAMLERYTQVCNLPINAYWYQPLYDIFEFSTAMPEPSVDVIIRDPIRTSFTQLVPSQSLNNALLAHSAANTYAYICDGVIVTHATVVNTIPHHPHVVLDAIPTSLFSITKFPQQVSSLGGKGQEEDAKKTEIDNTVAPLVSNTDTDTFEDILDDSFTPEFLEQLRDTQAKVKQFIKEHHGHRRLHYGANRLYKEVCTLYPGHRLPQSFFIDAIAKCALCQKLRLQKDTLFAEQIRTLKRNPYARSAVCVDRLTITPESQNGNTTVILLADLFTRLCKIYASSDYTSEAVAQCLKDWFITYGSYDVLQSDPGSDILGGAVDAINKRWKLSRKISLVDRHESNGNERLNQEALRHLRALCADERAKECWDDIDYLGFVNLVMNQEVNSEIGMSPFVATFGKRDEAYFFLPEVDRTSTRSSKKYIDKLNESLSLVRKLNAEHQRAIHDQRTSKTPPIRINQLRKNDVVWMRRKSRIDPNGKLQMRNKGPFVVISVLKNDVKVKHIITNKEETFHINDIFPVNLDTPDDELIETAKLDQDQFTVIEVIAWRGDTKKRMTLEFLTVFDDEYREWKHFIDPDFRVNSSLDTFIKSQGNEILLPLLHTEAEYKLIERDNSKTHIPDFTCIYADYRLHPLGWRDRVGLPPLEPPFKYVIEVKFVKRISDAKIKAHVTHPAYDITIDYNWFIQYGQEPTLNPNTMILIDSDMVEKHPALTFT